MRLPHSGDKDAAKIGGWVILMIREPQDFENAFGIRDFWWWLACARLGRPKRWLCRSNCRARNPFSGSCGTLCHSHSEAARREVALRERQIPKPPKTESRLILVRPEHEPPKDDPVVKYTTERPYLEKNKRYKRFSLR